MQTSQRDQDSKYNRFQGSTGYPRPLPSYFRPPITPTSSTQALITTTSTVDHTQTATKSTGPDIHPGTYTTNVGLPSHDWKFETIASSHITDSKAQFTTYRAHYGTITVGGNIPLSIYGIGTVEL